MERRGPGADQSNLVARPDSPLVGVVVLNWNGWTDTVDCVQSLHKLRYPSLKILVGDNGSTDDSVSRLRTTFPELWIIETGKNLGFSGGSNVGIRAVLAAGADHVWVLNNDTIVEPDSLSAMVKEMDKDPRVGIVGSVVTERDDPSRIREWGGSTFNPWLGTITFRTKPAEGRHRYISGTSILLRRTLIEELGGFDETYFFFMEDIDLAYRAGKRGWNLAVAPGSVVRHAGGASINRGSTGRSLRSDRMQAEGSGILLGKHFGWRLIVVVPIRIGGIVLRRVWRRQVGRIPDVVSAFWRGVRTGMRARGQVVVGGVTRPLLGQRT